MSTSQPTKANLNGTHPEIHGIINRQKQDKRAHITEGIRQSQQCESQSTAHHGEPLVRAARHFDQCQAELHSLALT